MSDQEIRLKDEGGNEVTVRVGDIVEYRRGSSWWNGQYKVAKLVGSNPSVLGFMPGHAILVRLTADKPWKIGTQSYLNLLSGAFIWKRR